MIKWGESYMQRHCDDDNDDDDDDDDDDKI